MQVTGLVLAAGSSTRLGQPKQLLPYRGAPLLESALTTARSCGFDQLVVVLGGSYDQVRAEVDLSDAVVVRNEAHGAGCSSSIASSLVVVEAASDGLVLMLGDQPGVQPSSVADLLGAAGDSTLPDVAVCRYDDGWGHPMWFARTVFGDLTDLHGDKGVWRLLHSGRYDVREVPVPGPVPVDVDTWEDYQALLRAEPDAGAAS
ncbi:nucleotidyltransferase family protein [Angustibacter luteus]|uniref:Nucleotidyltransferase family protein n=1 Tax=Angustibacter luteus TaxID=658456 RepID=A0ABW1JBD6_9ACTN